MAKLRWSPLAADDLDEITDYLARDSRRFASIFVQKIFAVLASMAKERLPGSMVPEYKDPDIRERLIYSHRVIVRVRRDHVEVVRIVHSARLLPPLFGE